MGDRGQVLIKDENVYLYTHWTATELPQLVKNSLQRGRERWDDPEYLARIIFSDMIQNNVNDLTGYGIGERTHRHMASN